MLGVVYFAYWIPKILPPYWLTASAKTRERMACGGDYKGNAVVTLGFVYHELNEDVEGGA